MSALDVAAGVLRLVSDVGPVLVDLYRYVEGGARSDAEEDRIARALIRKAFDERAKREIEGP